MLVHDWAQSMRKSATPTTYRHSNFENSIKQNRIKQNKKNYLCPSLTGHKEETNRTFNSINNICLDFNLILGRTGSMRASVLKTAKFIECLWLLNFWQTSLCWACLQMSFLPLVFFLYSVFRPGWTFLISMHFFSLTICYYTHWEVYFLQLQLYTLFLQCHQLLAIKLLDLRISNSTKLLSF